MVKQQTTKAAKGFALPGTPLAAEKQTSVKTEAVCMSVQVISCTSRCLCGGTLAIEALCNDGILCDVSICDSDSDNWGVRCPHCGRRFSFRQRIQLLGVAL